MLISKKFNNKGMTLVEMIATFALMGLFMVAATRVISYTTSIYYNVKGATYGIEVTNAVASKIVGQLEGAKGLNTPTVTKVDDNIDQIYFTDATGSDVTVSVIDDYLNIKYDAVTGGTVAYEEVNWRFDSKVYMGYNVKELHFENPGDEYPPNVVRMVVIVHSPKYGDFQSQYFIKCSKCDKIEYKNQ